MNHKLPRPVIAIVILAVIAALYFGLTNLNSDGNGELTASGSIEATIVNISPELSGKILEVDVEEGALVTTNTPLLHLDPSLLTAQRAVASAQVNSAKAALALAQNKLEQTLQVAFMAEGKQQASDWRFSAPDEFTQPMWYFHSAEQMYSAQAEVELARNVYNNSLATLAIVLKDLNNLEFVKANERLEAARIAFLVAKDVKIQAENAQQSGGLLDAAYDYYNDALKELNEAQLAYNDLLDTTAAQTVLDARAQVALTRQRHAMANARFVALQLGWNSPAVISAQDARAQAEKSLEQAEANLSLLDTQIAKLDVFAVMDGVILTRNVEPGEFVQPGATALTMADLTDLTITVYVPEDRYGQVSLGQTAEVRVDSFPDLTFTATIVHIADQAEFTPRNVQTVEGRSSTFYAIKLKVNDPDGKLKIGMPADVVFK